jgi:hypothetical protein
MLGATLRHRLHGVGRYVRSSRIFYKTVIVQNLLLPGGAETQPGPSLHVSEVAMQHAGLYVCTADNGLGRGAAAGIQLAVLCKAIGCSYGVTHSMFQILLRWTWSLTG